MLPTHRAPSAGESLSRLSKGVNPFSKPILRFLVLGCCIVLGLWFVSPFFTDFLWGPPGPPPDFDYFDQGPPAVDSGSQPHRPAVSEDQAIWSTRRDQVREAFKHAWTGYKTLAYPADELFPVSGGKSNK
jgi:mannosyl-oligosaccharide alpha-1,2-mannosidase